MSYVIGLMHVKFSEIWPTCHKMIKLCRKAVHFTTVGVLRSMFSTIFLGTQPRILEAAYRSDRSSKFEFHAIITISI